MVESSRELLAAIALTACAVFPSHAEDVPDAPIAPGAMGTINGSFERDADGRDLGEGWCVRANSTAVSRTDNLAKFGKHSVLVEKKTPEGVEGLFLRRNPLAAEAGKVYELSMWVCVTSVGEKGGRVRGIVNSLDENGNSLLERSCAATAAARGWQRIAVAGKAPAGSVSARLLVPYISGVMTVYVDGVEFKEVHGVLTDIHDLQIPVAHREKVAHDPNFWYFGAGGHGILLSAPTYLFGKETDMRRAKTIGLKEPGLRGLSCIAEDIKYHPYVGPWSTYSRALYPHNQNGRFVGYYLTAAKLTSYKPYLERMMELCEFLLYSQYDENGRSPFLRDYYPEDYATLLEKPFIKQYRGGWPTHDFSWSSSGYTLPKYEPSHHMDANAALGLLRAFQLTCDNRYLDAARLFVEGSNELFGIYEGEWKGMTYYWTEYEPVAPIGKPDDVVDNIISAYAMPVAALGYYTRDEKTLEFARGLLWYMCKEIGKEGRWYYYGEEGVPRYGPRKKISHEVSCLLEVNIAMLWLEAAGVDVEPMRPYLSLFNITTH